MNWLGASVRLRLIVLCIGLFCGFVGSTALLLYLIDRMRDDHHAQSEQERRLAAIAEVESALGQYRHVGGQINSAILTHDKEKEEEARVALQSPEHELRASLERLIPFESESQRTISAALRETPTISEEAVRYLAQGDQENAAPLLADLQRRMDLVEGTLEEASRRQHEKTLDIQRAGEERSTVGLRIAIGISTLTALAEILLILTVLRSIIRPLKTTSAAIRQVNRGELSIDLPPIGLDEFGEMAQAVRHFRDRAEKLQRLAYQDPLTGLGNRAHFSETLTLALERASLENLIAVLYLDLDRFRSVNERLGHARADRYLCEVVGRLLRFMPDNGTLFRQGGDRFAILLDDLNSSATLRQDLQVIAESLQRGVAEPFPIGGEVIIGSTSVGIGIAPEDGNTADQLVGSAEAALHTAKREGRNKIRFAGGHQTAALRRRVALATDIARGLKLNEFELFYQPIVDYFQRRIVGAEGLVRWRHPVRGLLHAGEFIDVAEEEGLIVKIGEECLLQAHDRARDWHRRGMHIRIAVNVSAQQLQEDRILSVLKKLHSNSDPQGGLIDLELTESTFLDHSEQTRTVLENIKGLGYRLSLDDFGTGYSSLSYIQRLPIDKIKIDRQFVATMGTRPQALAVVTATLSLARALHLEVVGEGVETESQADLLLQQGCGYQQGFLFSPALPWEEFEAWAVAYGETYKRAASVLRPV